MSDICSIIILPFSPAISLSNLESDIFEKLIIASNPTYLRTATPWPSTPDDNNSPLAMISLGIPNYDIATNKGYIPISISAPDEKSGLNAFSIIPFLYESYFDEYWQ